MQLIHFVLIIIFCLDGFVYSSSSYASDQQKSIKGDCLRGVTVNVPQFATRSKHGNLQGFFSNNFKNPQTVNQLSSTDVKNQRGRVPARVKEQLDLLSGVLGKPVWLLSLLAKTGELDQYAEKIKDIPDFKQLSVEIQRTLELYLISVASFLRHATVPLVVNGSDVILDPKFTYSASALFAFDNDLVVDVNDGRFIGERDGEREFTAQRVNSLAYYEQQIAALIIPESGETTITDTEATSRLQVYIEHTIGQSLLKGINDLVALFKSKEFTQDPDSFDIFRDVWNIGLFSNPKSNSRFSNHSVYKALSSIKIHLQYSRALLSIFNYRLTIHNKVSTIKQTSPAAVLRESIVLLQMLIDKGYDLDLVIRKFDSDVIQINAKGSIPLRYLRNLPSLTFYDPFITIEVIYEGDRGPRNR